MAVAPVKQETPIIEPQKPSGCEIVSLYNWDYRTAKAVCLAESGGDPTASNWNDHHNGCIGSFGLMQIACIHTAGKAEYDPYKNMAIAYNIYKDSGWSPWGAFTSGKYLQYLQN